MAKDEDKQKQIREKATKDATSSQARTIGVNSVLNPTPNAPRPVVPNNLAKAKQQVYTSDRSAKPTPPLASTKAPPNTSANNTPTKDPSKASGKQSVNMFIQAIPPFKGSKPQSSGVNGAKQPASASPSITRDAPPNSPTTAARLNVNASSFRPNPKANAFSPVIPHRVDVVLECY